MIRTREGVHVDLAHLPPDDPEVYGMLQEADTVGVFQVESRAQMATLPRTHPEQLLRPGHPGRGSSGPGPSWATWCTPTSSGATAAQPVVYRIPSLEPILERTLGVPLFQEQLLRMAMVAAGFTGGEAEELRRAMGFKRSSSRP